MEPASREHAGEDGEPVHRVQDSDSSPSAEPFHPLYQEMRRLARVLMAGQHASHTLQATALANEAFLRIADRVEELQGHSMQEAMDYLADAMR